MQSYLKGILQTEYCHNWVVTGVEATVYEYTECLFVEHL